MADARAAGPAPGSALRAPSRARWGASWLTAILVPLAASSLLPPGLAAGAGVLRVEPCLPIGGVGAQVGLHLALVRPAAECESTGLALGGSRDDVLAVIVTLALPALLLNLAAALAALGVLAAVRAAMRTLAILVGAAGAPDAPAMIPLARPRPIESPVITPPRGLGLPRPIPRRGPPAPAFA